MAKALEAFQSGHYAHALVLFEKEIQENSEDPYLYYHFALSCFHTKNHKKTIEVCETILDKFPGFIEVDRVYKLICFSHIHLHQWRQLEYILKLRLVISPRDLTLLSFLAHSKEKRGKIDSAISIYRKMLQYNPDHTTSLNNLGYLLLQSNNPPSIENIKEAAVLLKKALQIYPKNPAYLDSFGTLLEKTGNKQKAIQALEKAVSISPGQSELLEHLAKLYKENLTSHPE